jgi:hypothetical protein
LIKASTFGIRPILSEARNRSENDARIHCRKVIIADAKPVFHVGAEVFDYDIGPLDHSHKQRFALGFFKVQGQRAFIAVKVQHIIAVPRTTDTCRGIDA